MCKANDSFTVATFIYMYAKTDENEDEDEDEDEEERRHVCRLGTFLALASKGGGFPSHEIREPINRTHPHPPSCWATPQTITVHLPRVVVLTPHLGRVKGPRRSNTTPIHPSIHPPPLLSRHLPSHPPVRHSRRLCHCATAIITTNT